MASQVQLCMAVCLRVANNTNDNPTSADLAAVEDHWAAEFGDALEEKMKDAGIDDTPTNRAIVQMIATLSPGTSTVALRRACAFVKALNKLP